MADKVVSLEFNVKTAGAVTEINKVTKATEGATAATIDYEKQLNDIKKATEGAGFKDLSRALKEYQDIALKAGETTPIGRQALAEAGELKDRLLDLKGAIKTTGQDGLGLQASLQLGGGIVAGFGAVQGVMALVGSESEDLQKTLVKLQAVQATLASVEEIRSVLEKESALRITAVTIAEKARAAATAVSTFVTTAAATAMGVFRLALIGTGIGAFIVALGFLIANFDKVKNAIMNNTEGFQTFKKVLMFIAPPIYLIIKAVELLRDNMDKVRDTFSRFLPILDSVSAKALENAEKIAKAAQIEKDAVEKRYDFEIEKARAAGKETENLEIAKFNAVNERLKKEKEAIKDQVKATKEVTDEQKDRFKEISAEILANDQAVEIKKIEIAKKAEDKRKEAEKEAEDKRKKAAETEAAEAEAARKFREDRIKRDQETAKEIAKIDLEFEENKKKKEAEAQEKADAEKLAKELKDADDKRKKQDQDLADEIRIRDAKVQIANDLQSTLTSLGNLIINDSAKAVKFNKAMALIQIGIDTATALSKALSVTQSPSPDNVATGGLAGVAKYAGIAAMIFANAAKAKQILSSGNAAGSPPTLGGGGSAPTQAMQTQAPQTPGRVSNITGSQTTTVKAIVVESDITTTQKRINSIQEIAKI